MIDKLSLFYGSIFMNLGEIMQRYFLNDHQQIKIEDHHHIRQVMRMKTDDRVELCDTQGNCFLARLIISLQDIQYENIAPISIGQLTHHVTLIQGLGKGDKNEFVIKYATQFGIDELIFVEMKRSIAKMDLDTFYKKSVRYEKIAEESARLSHRNQVPTITFVSSLKQLKSTFDYAFVAYENDRNTTFIDKIKTITTPSRIALLIGPEGGIDDSEMALLKDKDFLSIGLGDRILQTEVACLYGLTLIDAILERKR